MTTRDRSEKGFSRRRFLANTSALSGASFLALPRTAAPAEPPPEITRIRLVRSPAICFAPQYVAEDLLRLEGFSDVIYVDVTGNNSFDHLVSGDADVTMDASPAIVYAMDAGKAPITIAGIHAGCYELFGNERVRAVRDLKGKSVAVFTLYGPAHVLLASMMAYVGMDPKTDVNWIVDRAAMRMFAEGKTDAYMGFAPEPQELRAKKIGHVIVNTAQNRPWSQYFCCMLTANRDFVSRYPVATKRAVRAFLKAADLCAQQPERAAQYLVAKGYEKRYQVALEVVREVPFRRWREANPEDTLRFHALRLHEVGMIKSKPHELIANGTDWRFLDELKKELKV
jgi:NitT/TauT family transport system substrate-binding protein